MKKTVLLLLASICISPLFANQNIVADNDPIINIPIPPTPPKNDGKPRSIVDNDIEATYHMGALTIVFNTDLGDADIIVCNLNTGDVWSGGVSGMGIETILLSGEDGYYTINIYTDNGEYYGEMWL